MHVFSSDLTTTHVSVLPNIKYAVTFHYSQSGQSLGIFFVLEVVIKLTLKCGPVLFFKIQVSFVCWESLLNMSKFKISVKLAKPFGCTKQFCKLQLTILYCVNLILMVTIYSHVFNAIFSREHILAIKFLVGKEKNMGHLLIPKSQKVWKKKKKKKDWAPLNQHLQSVHAHF